MTSYMTLQELRRFIRHGMTEAASRRGALWRDIVAFLGALVLWHMAARDGVVTTMGDAEGNRYDVVRVRGRQRALVAQRRVHMAGMR